ncbi:EGF like subdomain protein [Cooperia oncophora]
MPSRSPTTDCSGVVCPIGSTCQVLGGIPQCGFTTAEQSSSPAPDITTPSSSTSTLASSPTSPSASATSLCSGVVCPVGTTCRVLNGTPQCGFTG